ncbi:MAG: hypothetical protein ACI8XO_000202 [Verrucomicrobiales bacterium]|jgi:hypothetical protein
MRAHPITASILFVALALQSSLACLWDSDTLAEEASGKINVLNVITGRFPRHPPAYYEARLIRVAAEVVEHPENLELYDDAGVACDRLHRSAEAIAWMEKKAEALERSPDEEHQYRYHANLGTFLIHQWFAAGTDPEQDAGARGAEHIRTALEINPDAHFGREAVQLQAIEWLLEERREGITEPVYDSPSANLFQHGMRFSGAPNGTDYDKTVEGLTGLVALGAAWESVDIFRVLATCLADRRDNSLAFLAGLRVEELLADGKTSLSDHFPDPYEREEYMLVESAHLVLWFKSAREVADNWQAARNSYIEEQIALGKHPDTDADFWAGFDEAAYPLPAMPDERPDKRRPSFGIDWTRTGFLTALIAMLGVVLIVLLRKQRNPTR